MVISFTSLVKRSKATWERKSKAAKRKDRLKTPMKISHPSIKTKAPAKEIMPPRREISQDKVLISIRSKLSSCEDNELNVDEWND